MIRKIRQGKIGRFLGLGVLLLLCFEAGCGGSRQVRSETPVGDREFDRLSRMARSAFENGQIDQAIKRYEKALARAYIADDLDAIVNTRYNLGVCYLRKEDFGAASETVEAAQRELQTAGRSIPADLLLVKAAALYYDGFLDQAWQITEDILSMQPAPSVDALSRTHFLRGRVAADRNNTDQLRKEVAALDEPSLPGLQADRFELIGREAMLDGRWEDAVTALDQAARKRAENGNYRLMADTLAAAAQACERAQRLEDGAYRYLRAARSAALSGDSTRATAWLREALRLAEESNAEALAEEARRFQSVISQESPPQE